MMKKFFVRCFSLVLAFASVFSLLAVFAPTQVSAASTYTTGQYTITEKAGVNYRKGPGTSYAKVGAYKYGTLIQVLEVKNGWGRTSKGWLSLAYAKKVATSSTYTTGQYTITEKAGVNCRKGPGTSYAKVGAYKYGTVVQVLEIKNGWGRTSKGWLSLTYAKKISTSSNTTTTSNATTGIPASAYKKTGVCYTVNGAKFYEANTIQAYNGVNKNATFFLNSNGKVETNADTLGKLYSLKMLNQFVDANRSVVTSYVNLSNEYLSLYKEIGARNKMGTLIGKSSGILLSIGSGNAYKTGDAVLDICEEVASPEALKEACLYSLLQVYTHNTVVYGTQAIYLMDNGITEFEDMDKWINAYAECVANFTAVEYLAGDELEEMRNSSVLKELWKYFCNVFTGLADAVIPDFAPAELTKYITDGVVALTDFAVSSGAESVYQNKLNEQTCALSVRHIDGESAKSVADKLASGKDWNSLVGKTVANIKNGNSYTKWYGSGNISAKAKYDGECTWYVLGRLYETTGIALKTAPHAKKWLSANKDDTRVKVLYGADKIVAGSIAVNTGGTYGHVMFIEHVEYENGKPVTVYFTECNYDGNSSYNAGKDCILQKMSYSKFVSQRSPDGYIIAK